MSVHFEFHFTSGDESLSISTEDKTEKNLSSDSGLDRSNVVPDSTTAGSEFSEVSLYIDSHCSYLQLKVMMVWQQKKKHDIEIFFLLIWSKYNLCYKHCIV